MTTNQKNAVTNYLKVSLTHTEKERISENNELLSMTNVFESIKELRKHFDNASIDYIIINRDKLVEKLLN